MNDVRGAISSIRGELGALDRAMYEAVESTPTPTLDRGLQRLTRAADKSKLWIAISAGMALVGGSAGRRAALAGMVSVGATSALVNVGVKMIARRDRPERQPGASDRFVPMPTSTSFPSGHSASAFAFATGVTSVAPGMSVPLYLAAGAVAYSRVHTGVHYPGDVVAGSLIGIVSGATVSRTVNAATAASGHWSGRSRSSAGTGVSSDRW